MAVFSIALLNENLLILVNVHYQQIQEIVNKYLLVLIIYKEMHWSNEKCLLKISWSTSYAKYNIAEPSYKLEPVYETSEKSVLYGSKIHVEIFSK